MQSKPIFISKSLSPTERQDLISLIREYIYFFLVVMKTCPASILRLPCIALTSNQMLSRLSSNNAGSVQTSWRRSKPKLTNSLNVALFERNNTPTRLLTLFLFQKIMEIFRSALISVILILLVLRTSSHCPSLMS